MTKFSRWTGLLASAFFLAACASSGVFVSERDQDWRSLEPPLEAQETFRVYLIGDAGSPTIDRPDPVLSALQDDISGQGENSAVVFLGDNIYCCGLPDSSDRRRATAERRLLATLRAVENFKGRVLIIPGNHDWNDSRPGGLEAIRRQERFVESYLDRGNVFVPDNGFPGPVEIDLTDDITVLAIDTEWWLTDHPKSFGDDGTNEIVEPADFLLELEEDVTDERDKNLLVLGHHPIFSNGEHAGYLPAKDHFFPLTRVWKKAYLPLPIIGSLPSLYLRYLGVSEQDLAHNRYRQLRNALTRIFQKHERLIYASGHEHNLQYFRSGPMLHPQHYVVSGAGSRPKHVAAGHGATFTASGRGYASVSYYDDDSVWLSFWGLRMDESGVDLLFRSRLVSARPGAGIDADSKSVVSPDTVGYADYRDSTIVMAANPSYKAGAFKRFFLGSHHRELWATPVRAPYLDLGRDAGGLKPLRRGGGLQTTSLRLLGADGKQYVLRSLDKDPSRSVTPALKETIAIDILQDQVASINPYGAYVIPVLADAVGIYHPHPRLVYVPRDPRLGPFFDSFAGQLMMLEDRPDDDMSDVARFGNSENVMSAAKMYEKITDDNDDAVDQAMFARARLLDMLLSDWDRHRDQWRWAEFDNPDGKGKIYRPIPRDRDWAFNRMNGLFPSLAHYFDRKFQDFEYSIGDVRGLTKNGLEQDRRFTSELRREDWLREAMRIQEALDDSVIARAVREMPESIHALRGQEMMAKLKSRRDELHEVADEYYRILARIVDVVGSNKHERYVVRLLDEGHTEVTVYKTNKSGENRKQIYQRVFIPSETKEIRLYGLDGNDTFDIEGVSRGIRVRCVGDAGADSFKSNKVRPGARVYFYDTPEGNTFQPGGRTKIIRTTDPAVTTYSSGEYRHDLLLPQAFFGSNPDDGIFVGGGVLVTRHGFKKRPFAVQHRIVANFAARTQAFNVIYSGRFVDALGGWDLLLNGSVLSPNNIRNFYGLGNETENTEDDRKFYQARLTQVEFSPALSVASPLGARIELGARLRVTDFRLDEDRFVAEPQAGLSPNTFEDQWFAGARLVAELSNLDRPAHPLRGFRWTSTADANFGFRNATDSYGRLTTDLAVYSTLSRSPQVTLALRTGAEHNVGPFPFYDASTLGGARNLRGFLSTRFAGRTAFFQNAEVRARLFRFSTYLAMGELGVLAFVDNGRVWTESDAPNKTWHQGYGGGLWTFLFERATIAAWVGASDDDTTFTLQLGFQY